MIVTHHQYRRFSAKSLESDQGAEKSFGRKALNAGLFLSAFTLLASGTAYAQPVLFSDKSCPVMSTLEGTQRVSLDRLKVNRECTTIYVKPPVSGRIELESMVDAGNTYRCEEYETELRTLRNIADGKSTWSAVVSNQDSTAAEVANATARMNVLNPMAVSQATYIQTFYEGIDGATATAHLFMDWESDIEGFIDQNKGRLQGIQVTALPVVGSYLSYVSRNYAVPVGSDAAPQFAKFIGIFPDGVQIAGLRSISEVLDDSTNATRLSPLIGTPANLTNTIPFGSGAAAQIHMTLIGTCPFYDKQTNRFKSAVFETTSPQGSPLAYLAATYTYFYPVQTEGHITINIDVDQVVNIVSKRIDSATGNVNATAIVEDMMDIQGPGTGLLVIVDNPPGSSFTPQQISEMKMEALSTLTHGILSRLGTIVQSDELPDVKFETKPVIEETRLSRHCGRSGFLGLSRKCSTHTYKVQVPQSVRETRIRQVTTNIKTSFTNKLIQFDTFLMFDTSTFSIKYDP